MRLEFRLADIGEGLEEAEIISWLVSKGEQVRRDQPLVEVMTDKSNAELPAPEAGTVVSLGGQVGDIISVGEILAVIDTGTPSTHGDPPAVSAASDSFAVTPAVSPSTSAASAVPSIDDAAPSDTPVRSRPKASPSTRRVAAERGIDLVNIVGSGPGGRILLADLDAASPTGTASPSQPSPPHPSTPAHVASDRPQTSTPHSAAQSPAPLAPISDAQDPGTVPLRGVRRAVAKNMAQSWSEIPHIHAFDHIDATELLQLKDRLRAAGDEAYANVTPLTFLVAAVARALTLHPQANASINMGDELITTHSSVNVGVAVAADQGLVVPVLRAADRLDFRTLTVTLAALVRDARAGTLPREHFAGGTVTITNFGALGGEQATPLIRPPESIILGFGSIQKRPFVVDDQVQARATMHTVAGADHRLLDGDITTAVLATVGRLLTDPLQLIL